MADPLAGDMRREVSTQRTSCRRRIETGVGTVAQQVKMGAVMKCSSGASPASLIVLPVNRTTAEGTPAANIMDFKPIVNIPTFGACAELLGAPCAPATTPWKPGSPTVKIGGMPALNNTSTCNCSLGGVITITMAGTEKTMVA
jgi:hypothetical protein